MNNILEASKQHTMIVKFGFSGTREGMSANQKDFIFHLMQDKMGEFHHGDCIGADAEAHDIATMLGWKVCIHPPLDESLRAYKTGAIQYAKAPYKVRNKNIVEKTAVLLAAPKAFDGRGGTWNTIEWAKRLKRQFYIILPNGDIFHDDEPKVKGLQVKEPKIIQVN